MQLPQSTGKESKSPTQGPHAGESANSATTLAASFSPSTAVDARRMQRAPAMLSSDAVLYLQRTVGNRAMAQLLASQRQTKPVTTTSEPSSQRTTEQNPEPPVQTKLSTAPMIQRVRNKKVNKSKNNKVKNSKGVKTAPLEIKGKVGKKNGAKAKKVKMKKAEKLKALAGGSWAAYVATETNFEPYGYDLMDWMGRKKQIDERITGVRPNLDDDEELNWLKEVEDEAKVIADTARALTDKFDSAQPREQGVRPRRNTNNKFATKAATTGATAKEDYAPLIVAETKKLYDLLRTLNAYFPTSSGGFSAKGRATEMDVEYDAFGANVPTNHMIDNSFIDNITFGGKALNSSKQVTKGIFTVPNTAGPLMLGGKFIPQPNLLDKNGKDKGIAALETVLPKVDTPQQTSYHNTPVGRDRGAGQYVNMSQTNATTYAWLTGVPGWEKQRWEWLHVRGASLGGATDGSNLVVGTRDCNTHMIPFESNLKSLAKIVRENDNYERVDVIYAVENVDTKAKHKVQKIGIKWHLVKASHGMIHEPQGEAVFYPLETGRNISKKEVELLESTLKEEREKATPSPG